MREHQKGHHPHDHYHPGKPAQDHLPQLIAKQDGIKDLGQVPGGKPDFGKRPPLDRPGLVGS